MSKLKKNIYRGIVVFLLLSLIFLFGRLIHFFIKDEWLILGFEIVIYTMVAIVIIYVSKKIWGEDDN